MEEKKEGEKEDRSDEQGKLSEGEHKQELKENCHICHYNEYEGIFLFNPHFFSLEIAIVLIRKKPT